MRSLGSDNHSGIHPDILNAICEANKDHALSYGEDYYTHELERSLQNIFGCTSSYVVFNGTGANVFALKSITESYNAIITAETSHINVDECGAPEKHTGCKIVTIPTTDGKLTPDLIRPKLTGFGVCHHSQPKVISIAQPTELGTLYSVDEIKALSDMAHSFGMYLYMDGARLANAIAALGCSAKQMTVDAGVDAASLGGTKNGLMIGEAVMFFGGLAPNARFERKHAMQLSSKQRFISAQLLAYLKNDLWLKTASHSNNMAKLLEKKIKDFPIIKITQSVDSNAVFAIIPERLTDHLFKHYFFYMWDETKNEVRWMTSFDTTEDDIEAFTELIYLVDTEKSF